MPRNVGGFITKQSFITGILTGIAVLLPGFGTIFVVITSIVAAVFISLMKNKDETINKMAQKLEEGLNTQLEVNRLPVVDRLLNPTDKSAASLKSIRENIIAVLNEPIAATRTRSTHSAAMPKPFCSKRTLRGKEFPKAPPPARRTCGATAPAASSLQRSNRDFLLNHVSMRPI